MNDQREGSSSGREPPVRENRGGDTEERVVEKKRDVGGAVGQNMGVVASRGGELVGGISGDLKKGTDKIGSNRETGEQRIVKGCYRRGGQAGFKICSKTGGWGETKRKLGGDRVPPKPVTRGGGGL